MTKNNSNRLTLNSLNLKVEANKAEIKSELNKRGSEVKQALHFAQKAERQHPGMARQITRNVAELRRLENLHNNLSREVAKLQSSDNPVVAQTKLLDSESIMNRLGAFENLDETVREMQTKLSDLEGTVTGHGVRITNVERSVDETQGSLRRLTNRVFTLENLQDKAPWAALIVGAIVGFIVYLMWYNWMPWKSVVTLNDGTEVPITYDGLHYFGSWLAAIAAGALVMALIIGFVRRKRTATAYDQVITNEPARTPYVSPQQPAEDMAPTTVLPTEGAMSGAR